MAEAYEVLSDPERRRYYLATEGRGGVGKFGGGRGGGGFGGGGMRRRGMDVFSEHFGDSAWNQWEPGDHITTEFVRGGRRVKLEIFPDGSSEENEEAADSAGSYSYV